MRITFLIVVVLSVLSPSLLSQEIIIPQNPLNGRLVFEEKGCIECHSIGGFGGTTGPSLTRDLYFGSVLELATIIWNHTPQMNRKFRQMTINRPQLTENEMLDLFGFLYCTDDVESWSCYARAIKEIWSKIPNTYWTGYCGYHNVYPSSYYGK